jgi:GT2 family glycosyltransferase
MRSIVAVIPTLGIDIARLNKAISSVQKHTSHPGLEIVVVDNSKSQTLEGMLPVDRIIRTGINLGYVGALELVRRQIKFDYLWSIQDDMELTNDVLSALLNSLENSPSVAMACPILLRNGLVPAGSCGGSFADESRTKWGPFPAKDCLPENTKFVQGSLAYLSAAGALFKKEAIDEVAGFNLSFYPLIAVDVDICTRLMEKSWEIALVRDAHISHVRQGSSQGLIGQTLYEINVPNMEKYLQGSRAKPVVPPDTVDPEMLFEIARKASFLFLDLNDIASVRIMRVEQMSEARKMNFERSLSWKITSPLRFVFGLLMRFTSLFHSLEREK